jgi:hypothetical protein
VSLNPKRNMLLVTNDKQLAHACHVPGHKDEFSNTIYTTSQPIKLTNGQHASYSGPQNPNTNINRAYK